jgi:hypothetical protein
MKEKIIDILSNYITTIGGEYDEFGYPTIDGESVVEVRSFDSIADSIVYLIDKERLSKLLNDMDVPEQRKTDFRWLNRNLGIRNSEHPNFRESMNIIQKFLK